MKTSWRSTIRCQAAIILVALLLISAYAPANAADTTWHGEYFANPDLSGNPTFTRDDTEINFDWHLGSPDARLPDDHFSIRWTRTVYLPAGQWRFNVAVDDGIRLFVDGQTIVDQWRITAPITYTSSVPLSAGDHNLRLEYYENTERAQVRLWWDQEAAAAVTPLLTTDHAGSWQGSYFDNRGLTGDPVFQRDDAVVGFDWGSDGPGGGIAGQEFSVRWYRKVNFPGGTYRFNVTADDGVRIWLDWEAIVDQWHDSSGQDYSVERTVSAGNHEVVIEYYQGQGTAHITASWEDTSVEWLGNLFTCMRPYDSWIKIYRLAPDNQWDDLRDSGYGPLAQNGELKLFGLPIDGSYGWDGQPYLVELWESGRLVQSNGNIFAGQPALRLQPGGTVQTSWPCGASIPQ